ncbi:MAG: DnaJ domain-containing protein [Phycisphaeraceae bacterium]|nr:DnaJ domain-containing protein [Phycisphaeraceae bacterium]
MAVKFQDYYETLGVARTATQDEIQRAYRKLARKYHPDVNKEKGAEAQFKKVTEAYEVLSDPEKRKRYNELGENWKAGQEFTPPPGWEQRFRRGHPGTGNGSGQQFHFEGGDFSDFFESFFGGSRGGGSRGGFDFEEMLGSRGAGRSAARQGQNVEADIMITLEEAYRGTSRQLTLRTPDGKTRTLTIKVPPGTLDGQTIRVAGQGSPGIGGAPAGDLLLHVRLAEDPRFRVDGRNLTIPVHVAPWEAALGAKVPVRTLDGELTVTIPPGSQSGQKLRIKGKGLPGRGSAEPGDLFAQVKIVVPKTLTDRERELFEELKKETKFDPRT